jgi:hypothetical protein
MAAWFLLPGVVLIALNLWATVVVTRDGLSSVGQRAAQIAIVWAVPLVGALLVLHLKKQRGEKPLGRYPDERDQGEDDWPTRRRPRTGDDAAGGTGSAMDGDPSE